MTVADWVSHARSVLEKAPVQCADPLLHAKQLLSHGMRWEMGQVYVNWDAPLPGKECLAALEDLLRRRSEGIPFQYLVGHENFWNSSFEVGPGVLIPRKETECLVEQVLRDVTVEKVRVGELGAGTGNIGISLLQERPQWGWVAYEKNPDSLPYLRRNRASLLGKDHAYEIREGDFFLLAPHDGPFDLVISNPPYVAHAEMEKLSREVRHEPALALDGGGHGHELPLRFFESAFALLSAHGTAYSEIGSDQKAVMLEKVSRLGFTEVDVFNDYAGLPRVVRARKGTK